MLVLLVATAKILAAKAGTSIHLARLPFQPACLACACYYRSCFNEGDFLLTNMH